MTKKKDLIQVKNPRTGCYIKIDKSIGAIISRKKTSGPYKNILIVIKPQNEIIENARI